MKGNFKIQIEVPELCSCQVHEDTSVRCVFSPNYETFCILQCLICGCMINISFKEVLSSLIRIKIDNIRIETQEDLLNSFNRLNISTNNKLNTKEKIKND